MMLAASFQIGLFSKSTDQMVPIISAATQGAGTDCFASLRFKQDEGNLFWIQKEVLFPPILPYVYVQRA